MTLVTCEGTDFCQLSEEILTRGASLHFRARGNSMRPFIKDGDVLVITPVDISEVQRGDVILFRQGERALVHRLVSRRGEEGETLIVKGDAHLRPDPPLQADLVLGKVTRVRRDGRRVNLDRGVLRWAGVRLWGTPPFWGSRVYHLLTKAQRGLAQVAGWAAGWGKSPKQHDDVP